MNRKLLVIGCGGRCLRRDSKMLPEQRRTFPELVLASRTKSKSATRWRKCSGKTATKLSTQQVDADNVDEVVALIRRVQPDAVLNVALPYQDLTIMEACLSCGVHYIDTANFEPERHRPIPPGARSTKSASRKRASPPV